MVETKKEDTQRILKNLKVYLGKKKSSPMVFSFAKFFSKNPFIILVSCLLSLRSKDVMTIPVCMKLFDLAKTPKELLNIPVDQLEEVIRPIGFFRKKAIVLKSVSAQIVDEFGGKVPRTEEELLSIGGVGRKTANLVLSVAFDIPAICVDVHVHRIFNRLGLIKTKTPGQTEVALAKLFPKKKWSEINELFVAFGQNVCTPTSPICSDCPIRFACEQRGVARRR